MHCKPNALLHFKRQMIRWALVLEVGGGSDWLLAVWTGAGGGAVLELKGGVGGGGSGWIWGWCWRCGWCWSWGYAGDGLVIEVGRCWS